MVVQHNLTAMNANRMLGLTSSALAKSIERLSSGYRINRAADDAAGLAISEKMRKQIRGLTQAVANAQDGISVVQTAEGALAEVQDMLQRMNELAVKAANGTNSESDRKAIQQEIDQLTTEIDRVAGTTKFNETYLLKGDKTVAKGTSYSYGTFTGASVHKGEATFQTDKATGLSITFAADTASAANMDDINQLLKSMRDSGISVTAYANQSATGGAGTDEDVTYALSLNGEAGQKYTVSTVSAKAGTFNVYNSAGVTLGSFTASGYNKTATEFVEFSDTVNFCATGVTAAATGAADVSAAYYDKDGKKISANDIENYFTTAYTGKANVTGTIAAKADAPKVYDAVGNQTKLNAKEVNSVRDRMGAMTIKLHVGADATTNNQISLRLETMSSQGLGINGLRVDGTDDSNALDAIGRLESAIKKVSAQRSALGAVQNRLEHTINNLNNVIENTTSAESAIRDTDMAAEMVEYSKLSILSQVGQAMLAQANQSNQGVLSLLG